MLIPPMRVLPFFTIVAVSGCACMLFECYAVAWPGTWMAAPVVSRDLDQIIRRSDMNSLPENARVGTFGLHLMSFIGAAMLLGVVPVVLERLMSVPHVVAMAVGFASLMIGLAPVLASLARSSGREFRPWRYALAVAVGLPLGMAVYIAIQAL